MKLFVTFFSFCALFSFTAFAQTPDVVVDPNALLSFFKDVTAAYSTGGLVLAAATAVYCLVKLLRLTWVQALLGKVSPKLVWSSWPKPVCALVVFAGSAAVALAAAIVAGTPWLSAIPLAVTAGLGAMGTDAVVGTVKVSNPS